MSDDNANGVDVGIEHENSAVPGDGADVYAYTDDGEYATVWCVFRHSDYEVSVTTYRCESGLAQRDGNAGKKYFEVDADTTTESWAKEYAESHKESVDIARDYFN